MKKLLSIFAALLTAASCTQNESDELSALVRVSIVPTPGVYDTQATLRGNAEIGANDEVVERGFLIDTLASKVNDRTADRLVCRGEEFVLTAENLSPEHIYYAASYVETSQGTFFSPVTMFSTTTTVGLDLSVAQHTAITARTATLTGIVDNDFGQKTISVGVRLWRSDTDKSTARELSIAVRPSEPIVAGNAFGIPVDELTPNTEYTAQLWAMNLRTAFSEEFTFSTLGVELPAAASGSIDNIATTTAEFNASHVVSQGNDPHTEYGVFLLPAADYAAEPASSWTKIGLEPNAEGRFSHTFTALKPKTDYVACAFAENEAGIAIADRVPFTTQEMNAPLVETHSYLYDDYLLPAASGEVNLGADYLHMRARNVSTSGAEELSGYGFFWGLSPQEVDDRANTLNATDFDSGNGLFSAKLTGLSKPGQVIYYRAWASNEVGETLAADIASVRMPVGKPQYRKNATDKTKTELVTPENMLLYYELDPINVGGGESFIFLDRNLGAVRPESNYEAHIYPAYGGTEYRNGMFDAVGDYYSFGTNTPGLTIDVRSEPSYDMTLPFGTDLDGGPSGSTWSETPCPAGYAIPTREQWQKMIDKFGTSPDEMAMFKSALRISGTSFVRTGGANANFCVLPNNYNQWSTFLAASTRSAENAASTNQMDYLLVEYEQIKGSQAATRLTIEISQGQNGGFANANHWQLGIPIRCLRVEVENN